MEKFEEIQTAPRNRKKAITMRLFGDAGRGKHRWVEVEYFLRGC